MSNLESLAKELRPSFVDANRIQALKKTLKDFFESKSYSWKKAAFEEKKENLIPVEKEFAQKIEDHPLYIKNHRLYYQSTYLECLSELHEKLSLKEMNDFLETLENKLK